MAKLYNCINGVMVEMNDTEKAKVTKRKDNYVDGTFEANMIREKRDSFLHRSDWRASSDITISDEWKAYRKHLRDIPSQSGFPKGTIDWGTKPS